MKFGALKAALLSIIVTIAASASSAAGAGLEELSLYPFVQHFSWQEYRNDGSRLLRESGPQFGVGSRARIDLHGGRLMLQAKGELFGGEVGYDGSTQPAPQKPAVSEIPAKTDVVYFGTTLESDIGWRTEGKGASVEPFAGIGYRWWLRDLQDSVGTDRTGNQVQLGGYSERWQSIYSRLGLRAGYAVNDRLRLFAEGGGKYPFLNENRADFPGVGKVLIKPGKEWSGFAEIGARFDRFRASLYYEGFRFSKSPQVDIGDGQSLAQPKSDSDIFGVTLGWCFR